jgi:MFS family permease
VFNFLAWGPLRGLPPRDRRNIALLLLAGFLFWASLASLLPTFSPYLKSMGMADQSLGWIIGSFAVGLLVFRPGLGRMADRRGRWIVLLIGVTVAAIAPLGYLFTQAMPLLITLRIFHGLSVAAFTTAYSALAADLAPPDQRGELIGFLSLVNPVGMAVGPALGGAVVSWGYGALFGLAAGLGLGAVLSVLNVRVPPLPPVSADTPQGQPFWQLLWHPRLRIPTLVMGMIGMAFGTLAAFLPLFIQETGVHFNAGWFYSAAAITSFGSRLLTGRASDRWGRGVFISLGISLYALSMGMLWLAHSATLFLLAGLVEGAGSGIFLPAVITLIADRAAPHERGRLFGLCIAGFDFGIALAGPVFGAVTPTIGYRGTFAWAGGLATLGLLLFMVQNSKDWAHSLRFALGYGRDLYAIAPTQADAQR